MHNAQFLNPLSESQVVTSARQLESSLTPYATATHGNGAELLPLHWGFSPAISKVSFDTVAHPESGADDASDAWQSLTRASLSQHDLLSRCLLLLFSCAVRERCFTDSLSQRMLRFRRPTRRHASSPATFRCRTDSSGSKLLVRLAAPTGGRLECPPFARRTSDLLQGLLCALCHS